MEHLFFTDLRCSGGDAQCDAVQGWHRADSFFGDLRWCHRYNCSFWVLICSDVQQFVVFMLTIPYPVCAILVTGHKFITASCQNGLKTKWQWKSQNSPECV